MSVYMKIVVLVLSVVLWMVCFKKQQFGTVVLFILSALSLLICLENGWRDILH